MTTTRNPFDFYVAEWQRTRTRWVLELRDPGSWVHAQAGTVDRIVDAVTMDFEPWLRKALDVDARPPDGGHRLNPSHVDEADVVLRMEAMEDDLRDRLGLVLQVLPTNVTERDRAYWRSYSPTARRLVEDAHAADLERFAYAF